MSAVNKPADLEVSINGHLVELRGGLFKCVDCGRSFTLRPGLDDKRECMLRHYAIGTIAEKPCPQMVTPDKRV